MAVWPLSMLHHAHKVGDGAGTGVAKEVDGSMHWFSFQMSKQSEWASPGLAIPWDRTGLRAPKTTSVSECGPCLPLVCFVAALQFAPSEEHAHCRQRPQSRCGMRRGPWARTTHEPFAVQGCTICTWGTRGRLMGMGCGWMWGFVPLWLCTFLCGVFNTRFAQFGLGLLA